MKTKKYIILFIIFFLLVLMTFVFSNLLYFIHFSNTIDEFEGYNQKEYLSLELYGQTWDGDLNTLSGKIKILDKKGKEIAAIERSWPGVYLAVEFNMISFDGKDFVFPHCIYAKNKIYEGKTIKNKGTVLERYYLDNKKCLLPGTEATSEYKNFLYRLLSYANSKSFFFIAGSKNLYTLDLSNCKAGHSYLISYNELSGFTLIEKN